jgi:hypothetical protein
LFCQDVPGCDYIEAIAEPTGMTDLNHWLYR